MRFGGRNQPHDVAVIERIGIEEPRVIDARQRRRVRDAVRSLGAIVQTWATAVRDYEPHGGLAVRTPTRSAEPRLQRQLQRDLDRLHWPDGARINRGRSDRARWS